VLEDRARGVEEKAPLNERSAQGQKREGARAQCLSVGVARHASSGKDEVKMKAA
jgi:hypothetical protein